MAQGMAKADYQAGKGAITAEYKSARAACNSFSGNANDICVLEAKGKERVALAELEASYKPGAKTKYDARVAKAEADYSVAKERCDDLAGNPKDVCVKEAKAAQISAKADAKAQPEDRRGKYHGQREGRRRAQGRACRTRTDAEYAVAKEKV